MSTLQRLTDRGLVKPPRWLPGNVQYETIMGSVAYGVSSDTSDVDVYGWAIPPKEDIFPHLRGEIPGFGKPGRSGSSSYQEHHVEDRDALAGHGRTYDLTIFGIVKFFALAMENNPNIIDSPVHARRPASCTAPGSATSCGRTAGCSCTRGPGPSSRGTPTASCTSWRSSSRRASGPNWSPSTASTPSSATTSSGCIGEVEQILMEGDIDLQRNNEQLKAIRRGEWTEERLRQWFADKESHLERAYAESTLRATPDEARIKALLLDCLEEHYGSLEGCVVDPDRAVVALRNIQAELDRVKDLL